jgi:hypothetical protein
MTGFITKVFFFVCILSASCFLSTMLCSCIWGMQIRLLTPLVLCVRHLHVFTLAWEMSIVKLKLFWNVGKLLPDYTVLQPRRQQSSYSPPWEPQILLKLFCHQHSFSWFQETEFFSCELGVVYHVFRQSFLYVMIICEPHWKYL